MLRQIIALGGPVIVVLMVSSIAVLAIALYKLWQFRVAGVGRHRALMQAVQAWDAGDDSGTNAYLSRSTSYLTPVVEMALGAGRDDNDRLISEAEARFARLERGLRILDNVAQLAPLLGLFGTVLGMIEAFQALQDAGSQVDPSILAGGIWVALMTTAAGLAVAMPTSIIHSWLESLMDAERGVADQAIQTVLHPRAEREAVPRQAAHA
ncbi:MotA/TolQ/ExbB proton channel family protein [Cognatiyoonia sp. IB215446]|uniref:MotA/TolQ/ExbB proton channel family protein n=1 Tax=Cognatiyoonia sp. IB215446 TaxID=3097355 RepID=UPI002A0EA9D8|nr:MotA/TolQ/ExbB proton channel family protein [Cognatiyoonia sp. IB215446]MDX8350496.1 MotA/TolQ/ExbB proton channel family protein [Cognatiyoonia sp. IB215446]